MVNSLSTSEAMSEHVSASNSKSFFFYKSVYSTDAFKISKNDICLDNLGGSVKRDLGDSYK